MDHLCSNNLLNNINSNLVFSKFCLFAIEIQNLYKNGRLHRKHVEYRRYKIFKSMYRLWRECCSAGREAPEMIYMKWLHFLKYVYLCKLFFNNTYLSRCSKNFWKNFRDSTSGSIIINNYKSISSYFHVIQ